MDRPHVALLIETSLAPGRDIVRGIARFARGRGPWALYHEPRGLEDALPAWLRTWRGDGVIARFQDARMARRVRDLGIPAVDVLGVARTDGIPLVHVDDAAIGRLAADHLLERGFRRFAFFGIRGENWSDRRREAFTARLAEHGGEAAVWEAARRTWHRDDRDVLEESLAAWITDLPRPLGAMVASDQLGPKVLEACRRSEVAVPEEIAVVGVDDDDPLCAICNPPLSSIDAGHERVGFEAAALLERLMQGDDTHGSRRVPPGRVAVRQSTDILAVEDPVVSRALRFIRERACSGLTVDDIVAAVPVSRSVLQRRFRTTLRGTIHDQIIETRLKRARELLAETDLPIAEIAERAGFTHQEYLGAVFRERPATTPAAFRRSHQRPG